MQLGPMDAFNLLRIRANFCVYSGMISQHQFQRMRVQVDLVHDVLRPEFPHIMIYERDRETGVQKASASLDSRFRGNDNLWVNSMLSGI
jgi:hypothetical protein